ncbi:MAG: hypothetical protein OEZ38_13800 [Gammaproteobacteria bacterium]|nr:hypothetical protein [Gammaproteobacteria bacterium]
MTPINKHSLFLLATTTLIFFPHSAYSDCSREDIEFYLAKNFTTEQITRLCETSSSPTKNSNTNSQSPTTDTELFLREAIKGRDVSLSDESLTYTLRSCIQYGEEDMYGFAPKACLNIKHQVALKGLKVSEPENRYLFFKPDKIEISGEIYREVMSGLEKYNAEDQQLILQKLETGSKTSIPVRDDISIDQVFQTLQQLGF